MIKFIKKRLFWKTEQELLQKELDLQRLEIDLNDKYRFLETTLIKEYEEEKSLLKSKENEYLEAIELCKSELKKLEIEFSKIESKEQSLRNEKQKHLNYVINIKERISKQFKEIAILNKELKLKEQILKEKSKSLVKKRKVVKQEEDLIETTIRGKKALIDKFGNFKRWLNKQ